MQEPQSVSMTRPLAMMAGAAVAGALAWGAIAHFSGYEIGWLAWGIGLLVGASALWAGGRGQPVAIAAGVVALLSIVGGRLVGIELFVTSLQDQLAVERFDRLEALQQSFSGIDLIFVLLGVSTAFGMVMNRTRQELAAAAQKQDPA